MKLPLEDILVDKEGIIVGKGVDSSYHFVDQNSKCPPVDWLSMPLILQYLWCQILWCSAKSKSTILDLLCEAKVCEL